MEGEGVRVQTLLIAGSRDLGRDETWNEIEKAYWLLSGVAPTHLITGCARGVDRWGEEWWKEYMTDDEDSILRFPADWFNLGRRAGYVRNEQMAERTHQAIIVWDGQSKGTKHMMDLLQKRGIEHLVMVPS